MSERFASSWLDLREPVDHRSRAETLIGPLSAWWLTRDASAVVDLGSGTGSNLRYLAPRLPGRQRWTLVDHDADLLGRVRVPSVDVEVQTLEGDLAEAGISEAATADLVTASALLDLVSEEWLASLVDACVRAGSAALFALTYDGTVGWPGTPDPLDTVVLDAVNQHQRRDKGTGAALGPAAAAAAEKAFRDQGYRTLLEPSPWVLGPEDVALARELIEGWARAAAEQRPDQAGAVRDWAARRNDDATRPGFALVVGHLDLLALPGGRP